MNDIQKERRRREGFVEYAPGVDKLPPYSGESEEGILACILNLPNESMGECIEKLKAGKEAFYDLRHQLIYEVMESMYEWRDPIDIITVQQRLKDRGVLDQVGLPFLLGLPDRCHSPAHLPAYIEAVFHKSQIRRLIATCTELTSMAFENDGDSRELMDIAERDIMAISEGTVTKAYSSMKELIPKAINKIEEYHQRQGKLMGIPTGLEDFDKMTGGLMDGDMIVVAARPSVGKTSLAMQVAEFAATNDPAVPVGIFSLEMTKESLALRTLCSRASVSFRNIQEGFMAERDFPKLTGAAGKLSKAPMFIEDISGISIMELRARARRMTKAEGIKLWVIDYLQLLHATTGRGRRIENRQQEITEISSGIKALAKDLKVPILVLSQLNRDMEKAGRKPRLSDLRESGAIEQDADVIGLLYRQEVDEDAEDSGVTKVVLDIAKQRNGPTGNVYLNFIKAFTRFESAPKVFDDDVPHSAKQPHND